MYDVYHLSGGVAVLGGKWVEAGKKVFSHDEIII